jgi:hypothetical protein
MSAEIRLTRDWLRPTFKQAHGTILAGATNPLWNDILEMIVDKVLDSMTDAEDGPAIVSGLNIDKWPVSKVVVFCGNGANQFNLNVFNYSAVVKLPLANLVDNVPLYLTSPRYINPDGSNGARKKWNEWQSSIPKTDTHAFIQLNGGGEVEDGKTIARLVADGFTVIQEKQARNQLSAFSPVI